MYPNAPMYQGGMPNYGFAPYQSQYQQGFGGYQQHQQGIAGRMVKSPEEITPQEVPTDGSLAFFPASDGSCIYGKRWMPDGSISTTRYVQDGTDRSETKEDRLKVIEDRIGALYDMVEDISDNMPRQQRRTRRKAVDGDE